MSDTTPELTANGTRVLAGDCTVIYDDGCDRKEYRGQVTTVVKPDNTVLVHDAGGYQPVAWLTRPESVTCDRAAPTAIYAHDGDATLRVHIHDEHGYGAYPASQAGTPVGECPSCGGTLITSTDTVSCTGCDGEWPLPSGATIRDERCHCGLPRMRIERGTAFDVCIDRSCESLDDAVMERYDREWSCPDCDSDLRILRAQGLIAGCDDYPACDRSFAIPSGTIVGTCDCGLPLFDVGGTTRCLDRRCERRSRDSVQTPEVS